MKTFTDAEQLYIELKLSKTRLQDHDFERLFGKDGYAKMMRSEEINSEIARKIAAKDIRKQRNEIKAIEDFERLRPKAIKALEEILDDTSHKDIVSAVKIVMGGDLSYINSYKKIKGEKDAGGASDKRDPVVLVFNGKKLGTDENS